MKFVLGIAILINIVFILLNMSVGSFFLAGFNFLSAVLCTVALDKELKDTYG
jgi:hypothetical protein